MTDERIARNRERLGKLVSIHAVVWSACFTLIVLVAMATFAPDFDHGDAVGAVVTSFFMAVFLMCVGRLIHEVGKGKLWR